MTQPISFLPADFYVTDTTPMENPVSGVNINIYSANGALFYAQAQTDADGHAGFLLPSNIPFQARFYKFQTGFSNPQLFTVLPPPAVNAFNVSANLLTPPTSQDPRLCVAYGYFRDVTGAPAKYTVAHFIAKFDPVLLDGSAVLKTPAIARSDEDGYMEINLIRNAHYDCTVQGAEDMTRHIRVPDAPNVNLPDLLFPVVSEIVLTPPGPFTLAAGTSQLVGIQVIASDGEDLGTGRGNLIYKLSDSSILGYEISPIGLTLVGVGPGTATLTIRRADNSIVRIPWEPIINGEITVTVTPAL